MAKILSRVMPKIRPGMKKPPADFAAINEALDEFDDKMKEIVIGGSSSETGKRTRKNEVTWEVSALNHERTKYVYDACYREKKITVACLQYCCDMGFIDGGLVKRWRISGYETLCCVGCVTPGNFTNAAACICRVPKRQHTSRCAMCGCTGCASGRSGAQDRDGQETSQSVEKPTQD